MRIIILTCAVLIGAQNVLAQTSETSCEAYGQEFSIYFEHQSSKIPKSGFAIIEQVIENLTQTPASCKVRNVKIGGHTETAGSGQYNLYLSQAMAQNVADTFLEFGIPAEVIDIKGLGENQLSKATRDNVRSPLNRRTEVKITVAEK